MVKKRLLLFLMIMALLPLSSVRVSAEDPNDIDLEAGYVDPENGQNDYPRTPILVPKVGINGYSLIFYTPCDGCTLRLSDENDNVVYTTIIPTGSTTLVLPSYLSGEYKIEIIQGIYCFWGYITL
jgi:hypothetical protein